MPVTWECSQCHRRVPLALQECRCGAFRPLPNAPSPVKLPDGPDVIAGPRFSWRELPRSVLAALGVVAVTVVAEVVWLILVPPTPAPFLPLLAHDERTTASPRPRPRPTPSPQVPDAPPPADAPPQ